MHAFKATFSNGDAVLETWSGEDPCTGQWRGVACTGFVISQMWVPLQACMLGGRCAMAVRKESATGSGRRTVHTIGRLTPVPPHWAALASPPASAGPAPVCLPCAPP